MAARKRDVVTREFVENVARIVGQNSACALALRTADEYGGPVAFINTGRSIVVVRDPCTLCGRKDGCEDAGPAVKFCAEFTMKRARQRKERRR